MDHMMPEMDGFEAVQIIRGEIGTEYAQTVPIIALTANAILGNEDLFLKNGFQAFLSKPIDIIRLDMIVNRYVRDKKLEDELSLTGKRFDPPLEPNGRKLFEGKTLDGVDLKTGLKRFNHNDETYLGILRSYLTQIQTLLEKIRQDPAEGQTPIKKNAEEFKIAMHSIKSTSYTIEARQIGSIAEELEKAADAENFTLIQTRNPYLISALEELIPKLKNFLEEINNAAGKPLRPEPDPVLLSRILEACAGYDMEQLDRAIAELEQYSYESQADLVEWLRRQIDKSELESIRERLSHLNNIGDEKNG